MKPPSKKLVKQLARRLIRIGVGPDKLPETVIGAVACGDLLLVVKRGPDLCNCCQKLVMRATVTKKTELPLRKLFKP